jgi:hypothetical protein
MADCSIVMVCIKAGDDGSSVLVWEENAADLGMARSTKGKAQQSRLWLLALDLLQGHRHPCVVEVPPFEAHPRAVNRGDCTRVPHSSRDRVPLPTWTNHCALSPRPETSAAALGPSTPS